MYHGMHYARAGTRWHGMHSSTLFDSVKFTYLCRTHTLKQKKIELYYLLGQELGGMACTGIEVKDGGGRRSATPSGNVN